MKSSLVDRPITTAEAARLIGRTPRWINMLIARGVIQKDSAGFLTPATVAQGALRSVSEDKRNTAQSAAAAALAAAKTKLAEMRLARESGKLVSHEEICGELTEFWSNLAGRLTAIPVQFTRDLQERRRLEGLINAMRREVAKDIREFAKDVR